jgi:hypothetical protein
MSDGTTINRGAPGVKQKTAGGREASLREKHAHLDSIENHIIELAEKLNQGDQKALQQVLDFFGTGRKCARWSYWNLLGLLRQRPDLQRPVTIREAAEVGHYVKRGVRPAAILVPRVIESPPQNEPSPQNSLRKEALPWKADAPLRLQLFSTGLLLQVWQEQSAPWAWLKATYPGLIPLELGTANSLTEAQDKALASLSEEQRCNLVKACAAENTPKLRAITYFNLVHCVVDLGRDTIGPKLMADLDETGEDLGQVLEGIVEYARSLGVEPIPHRRSLDDLASGSIGTAWADGKIFVSETLSPERKIGVWLHQLTHWLTHLRPEAALLNIPGDSDTGERPARHIRELQSEACAYVVSKSLGIPSSFSIGYLAGQNITKRDVELNMRVIAQAARELLQGITPLIKKNPLRIEDALTTAPEPVSEKVVPESWQEFEKALQSQQDREQQKNLSPVRARSRTL